MPQLEGLTEVGLAGLGGQPDRGRELGHTELRDQRRTRSRDRQRLVTVPAQQRRVVDRLRRMQVRPGDRGAEQVDLGGVGGGTAVPGEREHRGSGVEVRDCCGGGHGSILVEHVFEARVESVDIWLGKIGDPKAGLEEPGQSQPRGVPASR